ncbi:VCBS repeat-containing protein [Streptomyces sp. NPDC046862]|uniref:FG-GAP repeat domain-containing protein n=1 Tax=Streptomyces sp. NPDC046862 TaxID=3154603 RepID=UPI003453DDB8
MRTTGRAVVLTVCAVLLGSCGNPDGAGGASGEASRPTATTPDPDATPSSAPSSAPVPRGKGGKVPGDVNGDGHPDFAYTAQCEGDEPTDGKNCIVVLYGSDRGLDPAVRTVLKSSDAATPEYVNTYPAWNPALTDLDGDGYADIQYGASVIWGGPTGPRPDAPDVAVPGGAPGDFDADGHTDLAVVETRVQYPGFRVMYGPFDRQGKPDHWGDLRSSPFRESSDEGYGLHAGDADGDRTADLLATAGTDGGQGRAALLRAAREPARQLRVGSSVVFGDFDGDGKGDVVVGDSGSRNDEPGYETEAPEVDGTLTVYFGDGGEAQQLTGLSGEFTSGDLDGDGFDELLVQPPTGFGPSRRPEITVLHGTAQGLGKRTTLRRTGPVHVPGAKHNLSAYKRYAALATVGDFDGDGHAEAVLRWFLPSGGPSWWWIVEDDKDVRTFTDSPFTETGF